MTRRRAVSYIGACALLAACPPHRPPPLIPVALAPASRDSAITWSRTTLPRGPTLIRFRWRYQDERVKYAGRGTARVAPPDSLRFDYAGPFGLGSGAAVVIGDSIAWADPEQNFRSLVPAIPMLWAALRMVPPPDAHAAVFAAVDSSGATRRVIWRFAAAEDTLDFVASDGVLEAEWRQRGTVLARSRAQRTGARVDFPEESARFELTVGTVDSAAVIPPALWRGKR